ncbi:MAG TPA: SgcJ/EcaC family oxidoreductase [Longimicrobiaceae bacterium]|jgi:uncharacterized protein (TIGR02246 family)|nr:SgcJ/EcaC family oxidoreductase [Longimicrobiaceae bacterium]
MSGTTTKVLGLCAVLALTVACDIPPLELSGGSVQRLEAQAPGVDISREVQALVDAQAAAWSAKDAHAFAATYTADATFFNPLGWVSTGRDEIREAHAFLFAGPFSGSTETQKITAVRPLTGTIAVIHLESDLTGYPELVPGLSETEPGVIRTTKTWVVLKRGGTWEITAQHMAPVAPAPGG